MANKPFTAINEMLDKAKQFIEEQKGQWEHFHWDQLLSEIQKKGIELSDEAKHRFGEVLEGMKSIYHEAQQTEKISQVLNTIKQHALEFIQANREGWDHAAWEKLLADLKKSGVELTEETRTYLGHILEALRKLVQATNSNNLPPTA